MTKRIRASNASGIWPIRLRLTRWHAAPLMGVATDDSHSYHTEEGSTPGRGWIMVKARHLTPESLIRAMKEGEFYASSGVELQQITFDAAARQLKVTVQPQADVDYHIEFIGTRASKQRHQAVRRLR